MKFIQLLFALIILSLLFVMIDREGKRVSASKDEASTAYLEEVREMCNKAWRNGYYTAIHSIYIDTATQYKNVYEMYRADSLAHCPRFDDK